MIKTLVAGFISPDAKAFLQLHQVPIIYYQDLAIITLDEEIAVLNQGEKPLEYVVAFWASDGEDVLPDCVIVTLDVDAGETKMLLSKDYWSTFLDMPGRPVVL